MLIARFASFSRHFVDDVLEFGGRCRHSGAPAESAGVRIDLKVTTELFPLKRLGARGHFIDHCAEGEDVGAGVQFLGPRLAPATYTRRCR